MSAEAARKVVDDDDARFLRTEFLARVAHELRGPAGVTIGALEEIDVDGAQGAGAYRALLTMARRGALKVLHTADRLSRIAQLEAGTARMTSARADLRDVVSKACASVSALEPRRVSKLRCPEGDDPVWAELDAEWAQAALVELFWYALRVARDEIRVELVERAAVRITCASERWLPEGLLRFDPRPGRHEAGLALSLADEIARLHGGKLTLDETSSETQVTVRFARA